MADGEPVDCAVTLTPDGATAWFAEVHIPSLGLDLHMLPVSGQGDNEAMWDTYRWVRYHLPELDRMVRQLGPGQLSFANPAVPFFEPREEPHGG